MCGGVIGQEKNLDALQNILKLTKGNNGDKKLH